MEIIINNNLIDCRLIGLWYEIHKPKDGIYNFIVNNIAIHINVENIENNTVIEVKRNDTF